MAGRAAKVRGPGAQAPSHAGNCQTGAVGEGSHPARRQLTGPRSVGCLNGAKVRGESTVLLFRDDSLRAQELAGDTPDEILCDRYRQILMSPMPQRSPGTTRSTAACSARRPRRRRAVIPTERFQ
jgi:hypothetical protein